MHLAAELMPKVCSGLRLRLERTGATGWMELLTSSVVLFFYDPELHCETISPLFYFPICELRTVKLLLNLLVLFVTQWFSFHCLSAGVRVEIVKQLGGEESGQ